MIPSWLPSFLLPRWHLNKSVPTQNWTDLGSLPSPEDKQVNEPASWGTKPQDQQRNILMEFRPKPLENTQAGRRSNSHLIHETSQANFLLRQMLTLSDTFYFIFLLCIFQCSVTCGKGYKQRLVSCSEIYTGKDHYEYGYQNTVHCPGTPPPNVQSCYLGECPVLASWRVGNWGSVCF